jgi:hypothetical protein
MWLGATLEGGERCFVPEKQSNKKDKNKTHGRMELRGSDKNQKGRSQSLPLRMTGTTFFFFLRR